MRSRARIALSCSVLMCGALLYFARPIDPLAIDWLHRVGMDGLAETLHRARTCVWQSLQPPAWFRGASSDAAYAFSLGAFLAEAHATVIALGAMLVIGFELGQGLGIVPGTFDALDLLEGIAFFALGSLLARESRTRGFEMRVENAGIGEEPT